MRAIEDPLQVNTNERATPPFLKNDRKRSPDRIGRRRVSRSSQCPASSNLFRRVPSLGRKIETGIQVLLAGSKSSSIPRPWEFADPTIESRSERTPGASGELINQPSRNLTPCAFGLATNIALCPTATSIVPISYACSTSTPAVSFAQIADIADGQAVRRSFASGRCVVDGTCQIVGPVSLEEGVEVGVPTSDRPGLTDEGGAL
jgi:hypothetical protein